MALGSGDKTGAWTGWTPDRAAQLLVALLVIALAIEAALVLTRLMGHGEAATPLAPTPTRLRPAANPALQVANIVNAHLFGTAPQTGGAPETTMPLVLAGVIANRDAAKGQAIIGQTSAQTKLYRVGAMLPGGARLHEVQADRVIIDRAGTLETLLLPRATGHGGASSLPQGPMAAAFAAGGFMPFLQLVNMQPVQDHGKFIGERLIPNGSRGAIAFARQKLRAGDLVTAVNGAPLDDQARAFEIMQTLNSSASANLSIVRNNQPMELTVNLSAIANEADSDASGDDDESETTPTPAPQPPPFMNPRHRPEH